MRRQDLPPSGRDVRNLDILLQVLRHHDVGERAEHRDQLRHVDEAREPAHRLVFARRLDFEFGRRVAEGRGPGVEFVKPAFAQRLVAEQALDREHLTESVGDWRAGGQHERAAGILGLDIAGLDIKVPGPLRSVRVDAFQCRHIGRKREFAEFLRLVDNDLIDANFRDREKVVLAG